MRLAIHDFGGFAFVLQLSRELSRRGHDVVYFYASNLPGPHRLVRTAEGPGFATHPIELAHSFRKYSPIRRLLAHRDYAARLTAAICASKCDLVLSANTPIDIQYRLMKDCQRLSIPVVYWLQDIYGLALEAFLGRKLGPVAKILARPFAALERRVCELSAGVICITEDFKTYMAKQSIHPRHAWVFENWAPLDEVTPRPKVNAWSRSVGLDQKKLFLYSGTMGLKHNPALVYELARSFDHDPEVVCAVVSEGLGRDFLERKPAAPALRLFDFQPYSSLSELLSAADVLVAVIEPDASRFSVPSKVLSYLAAGRPVLLASPDDNLSARVVREALAGIVVNPRDVSGFVRAARLLLEDGELRCRLSANAREYAERRFRIGPIADAFENAIFEVTGEGPQRVAGAVAPAVSKARALHSGNSAA
jgi:glycosyltransferase involved in cell wall biosynthesis